MNERSGNSTFTPVFILCICVCVCSLHIPGGSFDLFYPSREVIKSTSPLWDLLSFKPQFSYLLAVWLSAYIWPHYASFFSIVRWIYNSVHITWSWWDTLNIESHAYKSLTSITVAGALKLEFKFHMRVPSGSPAGLFLHNRSPDSLAPQAPGTGLQETRNPK